QLTDGPDLRPVRHITDLSAQRQKSAAALFIHLPRVRLLPVDVRLVALQHPPAYIRKFHAPVLHTAVAGLARQLVLHLQLEIPRRSAAPDAKDVVLRLMVRTRLASHHTVLHSPELRIAIPALQGFAVEDRLEPGFLQWRHRSKPAP